MTTTNIRKKLHNYIADASDSKVKGMYMLLEEELQINNNFKLSSNQIGFLDRERDDYLSGKLKTYSWKEAKDIIKGNKKF